MVSSKIITSEYWIPLIVDHVDELLQNVIRFNLPDIWDYLLQGGLGFTPGLSDDHPQADEGQSGACQVSR